MDNVDKVAISGYWDTFYSHSETAPVDPSPFARWVDELLDSRASILEMGCGNGRDARFFARQGRRVMALDQSAEAIKLVSRQAREEGLENLDARVCGVETLHKKVPSSGARQFLGDGEVAVYARFFLHAIAEEGQVAFLDWLQSFLRDGEYCYLEYRASDLSADQYEFGSHYRRPVSAEKFAAECELRGMDVISSEESRDFAPYRGERPVVGRTVMRRAT